MGNSNQQELVPTGHGGAIKNGTTHGAVLASARFKAGQGLDLRTRQGKLYVEVFAATLALVQDHQGRKANVLESMAVEAVAQAYLIQRLYFNHAVNNSGDQPPDLSRRYTSHVNNLGKSMDRLARILGTSPEAIGKSMAERLAAMARPALPAPPEPDQGEVIDAEVVEVEAAHG